MHTPPATTVATARVRLAFYTIPILLSSAELMGNYGGPFRDTAHIDVLLYPWNEITGVFFVGLSLEAGSEEF